jgi:four helix bundle protein
MGEVRSYQDLMVWQAGMDLAEAVYELTKVFPADERFGLIRQLRRSAVSVPANIAEGHGRDSTKQYVYHVSVAMGSIAESETHLLLAKRFQYGTANEIDSALKKCGEINRMLRALQKSLRRRLED